VIILLLFLLSASPASARELRPATPVEAAANIRRLTAALLAAEKTKDAPAYAAARLALLENIAELQDWGERLHDVPSTSRVLTRALTPAGRAALGKRKPVDRDFVPRDPAAAKAASDGLDFKP
jgi:hypothetical protein